MIYKLIKWHLKSKLPLLVQALENKRAAKSA